MDKIVFISEMRNPKREASSTQIMVRNILSGMKKIADRLIFVPIITKDCCRQDVKEYYQDIADEIVFAESLSGGDKGRYATMFSMFLASFKNPSQLNNLKIDPNTIVVTHSPTIDSVLYAKKIKRINPIVKIIQYWSDPIALSLLLIPDYNFKRILFRYVENKILGYSDAIVYGTKSLYDNQKKFFSMHSHKMGYCDVCYNPLNKDSSNTNNKILFGYFGNYYSKIRNIIPFYRAFKKINSAKLIICGSGDEILESNSQIQVLSRVSQHDVVALESQIDVEVCILNKAGFQIPGKVFYATNTNKKILVLLDGPVADDIYQYLKTFKRFIFCENNEQSILSTINEIVAGKYDKIDKSELYKLTPQYVAQSILNGGYK